MVNTVRGQMIRDRRRKKAKARMGWRTFFDEL